MSEKIPGRAVGLIVVLALTTGCTIQQTVNPVLGDTPAEVCIVENPAVRAGFVAEYRAALRDKGILVEMLPDSASIGDCPVTSTYLARWSWDMTIYMSYAEINVYAGGALAGKALYDATKGGGRLDKFVDAEPKIRELVSQLFPAGEQIVVDPDKLR